MYSCTQWPLCPPTGVPVHRSSTLHGPIHSSRKWWARSRRRPTRPRSPSCPSARARTSASTRYHLYSIYTSNYLCIYVSMYLVISLYTHLYMYIYIYIHIHIHMYKDLSTVVGGNGAQHRGLEHIGHRQHRHKQHEHHLHAQTPPSPPRWPLALMEVSRNHRYSCVV